MTKRAAKAKPFISDITNVRNRARMNIGDGNVTVTYIGDAKKTIAILQTVLATESVLRYTMHAIAAAGISSEGIKEELQEHADEEREHMHTVAERIKQLGGTPIFNPKGLETRLASQYGTAEILVRSHDQYNARGNSSGGRRTRSDMHDLLVANQGTPMLRD